MNLTQTNIKDCYLLQPQVFEDDRGYFMETYNKKVFQQHTGLTVDFVQDNESMSNYGVIRGLHSQSGDFAQAKLIKVTQGKVLDVVVDARKDSPTYGKKYAVELNSKEKKQLFVPRGCLHGFSVLEDQTIFTYKCDNFYRKESEIGVFPLDKELGIDWRIPEGKQQLSGKDKQLLSWKDFQDKFKLASH